MKIAIITKVFLGEFDTYRNLKGNIIGGAEVYLYKLIKEVLEPIASNIVVYQQYGAPVKFSEKTIVITNSNLSTSKLSNFDLVILNGLQSGLQSIFSKINSSKTKSIAIHHGMIIPPDLTFDVLRTVWEYHTIFLGHAENFKSHNLIRLFLGEKIADLSMKPYKFLLYVRENIRRKKFAISLVNSSSAYVDIVVSVDKDSLRYVNPSQRAKWKVIYNFVDFNIFNPNLPRQNNFHGKTILVPRNLTVFRGVFIVPKLAFLLRKYGYRRLRFLIAGEGHLRPFLENEIKRLKLEKEVILLGHQDHFRDMPYLYANSDIVLVPSFESEGTSLAVLEGMASKKPVVTTNVGGIKDIGIHRKHKLSSSFNIKGFANHIAQLIEDESLMKKLAESGYEYVTRYHNISTWKKMWQEVIERV